MDDLVTTLHLTANATNFLFYSYIEKQIIIITIIIRAIAMGLLSFGRDTIVSPFPLTRSCTFAQG